MHSKNEPSLPLEKNTYETSSLNRNDFLDPNPFCKSWMLPYLPSNPYLRDMIIAFLGMAGGVAAAYLIYLIFGENGAFLEILIGVGSQVIFAGGMRLRYARATARYYKEKMDRGKPK